MIEKFIAFIVDRLRKKTRQEIQEDLFFRKRSRKNLKTKTQSFDIDGLPFDDDSSSGDDGFFMPRNKSES